MSIDLSRIKDGQPLSWEDLAPHAQSILRKGGKESLISIGDVQRLFEALPGSDEVLTSEMLERIPWGIRDDIFCSIISAMLDPRNHYGFVKLSDLEELNIHLKLGDFLKLHFGILRPESLPSVTEMLAMQILVSAYAMASQRLRGLEVFTGIEVVSVKVERSAFPLIGNRRVRYVIWVPPMTEVPNELHDLASHTNEANAAQRSTLTTAVTEWLNGYPQMVQQDNEMAKSIVVQLIVGRLLP